MGRREARLRGDRPPLPRRDDRRGFVRAEGNLQGNSQGEFAGEFEDEESSPTLLADVLPFPVEPTQRPTRGVLEAVPYGWLPILISGTLFGLAHLGHGVSPLPLVLFGIVLGYLYQRTHRLLPSITAHALFNAYSMTMLWLQLRG